MNKTGIFLLAVPILFTFSIASAQKPLGKGTVTMDRSVISIVKHPPINKVVTIPVTISNANPDSPMAKFVFVLDTLSVKSLQISPADTAQTISADTWRDVVTNKKGRYSFQLRIVSNGKADTSSGPETTFITIAGVPGQAQEVDLVNYDPEQPFWVEIGANFDLASQHLQTNNLFGGIFLYKKDIAPVLYHRRSNNLAIAAGVYESKNFSQNTSVSSFRVQSYLDSTSYLPAHGDTVARAYTDSGNVKMTSQIRNIGLFFSPQLRLTKKGADEDGIHLFASFYAELLWQDVQVNYDYSATRRLDTQYLTRATVGNYTSKIGSRDINYYSHYEGLGAPMFFKSGDADLYINPVFGASNQPSTQDINNAINNMSDAVNKKWRGFYLVQFRLSEEKYGISFSGEIRQLIGANSQPYITLVLSKKFVLAKLINFEQP